MPRKIPQDVREKQIRELATADGYTFVGWADGYKGNRSNVTINCTEHGEWRTNLYNFMGNGSRCPKCARIRVNGINRIPREECERQLRELAEADGYTFVGWVDEYVGNRSASIFNCVKHGEWSTRTNDFKVSESRCPSCAVSGYDPSTPGTLYALISNCGTMIKIGISSDPDKRYRILRSVTPFQFTGYRRIRCEDGAQPRMLERMFHDEFPSVGLRGFDGATEWRRMSPDVTTWFDLLGA